MVEKVLIIGRGEGRTALEHILKKRYPHVEVDVIDMEGRSTTQLLNDICFVRKGDYDLVFGNGLNTAKGITELRRRGLPTFGVDTNNWIVEKDRRESKRLLAKCGVLQGAYNYYRDYSEYEKNRKDFVGFPCFVKHRDGVGTISFRVDSEVELEFLVKVFGYRYGLVMEKPLEGIEVSSNFILNSTGYRYIGSNHDVKAENAELLGNVYTYLPPEKAHELNKGIYGLLNYLVSTGYRGVIAVTMFVDSSGKESRVIECNARLGFTSGYMYLENIKNVLEVLVAVAEDQPLPEIEVRHKHGITSVVHSALRREEQDIPVVVDKYTTGCILPNNVHDGFCDGFAPYLLISMGDDILCIYDEIEELYSKVQMPMKYKHNVDFCRFMALEVVL